MNQVIINDTKVINVPSKLNEMSFDQLRGYCLLNSKVTSFDLIRAEFLKILLNKSASWFLSLPEYVISDLLMLTDFIFDRDKNGSVKFSMPDLTVNKVKCFRKYLTNYYGPSNAITNTVFCEFIECEKHYIRYVDTQKEEHLDKLIATLYRKKKTGYKEDSDINDGDIRERFNPFTVTLRANKIKSLSTVIKKIIFLYYQGSRESIVKSNKFSYVFQSSKGKSTADGVVLSWLHVLTELSGQKFGDYEKTSYMNTYIVLLDLNNRIKISTESKSK